MVSVSINKCTCLNFINSLFHNCEFIVVNNTRPFDFEPFCTPGHSAICAGIKNIQNYSLGYSLTYRRVVRLRKIRRAHFR